MDIRKKVPVIKVALRGANGRMGLQAIYASMENNEDILERAKKNKLKDDDVWIDIVFGAFTGDIPTVQQLMAGVMRSEKDKILEGYDKEGIPIYRQKEDGKLELRTKYVAQSLNEEPQRAHVIPFDRQEIVDTPEGLPAIKILSKDKENELSTIRHVNVRLGELSGEAIMDRVLENANNLGTDVLLSCVGDTAKKAVRMKKWMSKIHDKGYSMGFLESAPAKGWESRLLSRQDVTSVLCSRNFSPTGTLFRTGLYMKRPLFEYNAFEFSSAANKFKQILTKMISQIIATDQFRTYAKILDRKPLTIKEIEGETTLINFSPSFLTITATNHLKFSFYEDNEYGFVYAAMIPNLKALGRVYSDKELVKKLSANGFNYEAVTNIPGIFGTQWLCKAPGEIISRGGAVSTSSCTTNGNVVADFIMIVALFCYYDFFYPHIKDYFISCDGDQEKQCEKTIEKRFKGFNAYLNDLISNRANMIRMVFNFYYDEVMFMETDMQHGLTRAESPDIIGFLRETTSGSQAEVPKLLSLPDRERAYFMDLQSVVKEKLDKEKDATKKAGLEEELQKITATIETINNSINIVKILEEQSAK
ncbi:MAG: hypothetical protein JW920_06985 [Deltaproteobacteria bacterium]|nr:hypothetical protein [Deltaproteobacteria bacterium]